MPKSIHALLIGINNYAGSPLFGCVNDALALGQFFQEHCEKKANQFAWNPRYLLAPHSMDVPAIKAGQKADPKLKDNSLPTRDNVIGELRKLAEIDMVPQDVCLIYYSGHGSQEPASPEFAHLKPDGMNETIVCMDSREDDGRDLVDKELAYLLAQIRRKNPDVHLLVIMDCCNSGSGTRAAEDIIRVRRERALDQPTPFEALLGINNVPKADWIFDLDESGAARRAFYKSEARHIHLAAARDSELAKETEIEGVRHGVFTHSLLRVLNQDGATALSYLEILRRTEALVRNRVTEQIPQLDAWGGAVRSEGFLGGAFAASRAEYPVLFEDEKWQLKAGALNGIVAGTDKTPTKVQLTDGRELTLHQVFSNYSVLDNDKGLLLAVDQGNRELRASIVQMPAPKISIFTDLPAGAARDNLNAAIARMKPFYCDFTAASEAAADYSAWLDESGKYMLLRKGGSYPVFLRQTNPETFVLFCDSVGKYRFVRELEKPFFEDLSPEDVEITLEVLDNVTTNTINSTIGTIVPQDRVILQNFDKNGKKIQPALRCTVKLNKEGYWVGGLYIDNEYGISNFLATRENAVGDEHRFMFKAGKAEYNAIPLYIKNELLKQGVREITEYLKIFISNRDFKLTDFEQASLPLDTNEVNRGPGFDQSLTGADPEWTVITIPVKIVAGAIPVDLPQLKSDLFQISGLQAGFKAKAAMISPGDAREKLAGANLNRNIEATLSKYMLPPASLWGESIAEAQVFSRSMELQPDQTVSILELTEVPDELTQAFTLDLAEKLSEDEVIIPYGYSKEADMYLPMGFSNVDGNIEITALPSETPGVLSDTSQDMTRDPKGSIKLFFKKLLRRKLPNTLALVKPDLSAITAEAAIKKVVEKAGNILLLTHGIFGDTSDKVHAVMKATDIHTRYDAVLSFDYENLNTDLRETARDLAGRLARVGAFLPDKGARLTIVAPSMGGLMCRWMVEIEPDAAPFVKHVLLVATPNLGSELSGLRKRIFGLMGKALNGSALLKPYLIPLSFLAKKADKAFWRTLNDMDPTTSKFLAELNAKGNLPGTVTYSLLGGNLDGMTMHTQNEGSFWKRFKKFALKKALDWSAFDGPHDMCVEVNSQQGTRWLKAERTVIIPADHLSYFTEDAGRTALRNFLVEEQV